MGLLLGCRFCFCFQIDVFGMGVACNAPNAELYNGEKMRVLLCFLGVFLLSSAYGNPTEAKLRLRAVQIADSMDIKTLAAQVILTAAEGKATLT